MNQTTTTDPRTAPRSLVQHQPIMPTVNPNHSRFKSQIPIRARYGQRPGAPVRPLSPARRHNIPPGGGLPASMVTRQSFDKAFNVYRERSRLDTRDLQTMLMDLLIKEQKEKEKWHLLCMKVMNDRDILRRRMETFESRGVKREREREEPEEVPKASTSSSTSSTSSYRVSPVHSPPGSPFAFPVHSPSGSPPPLSGSSLGSFPPNSASTSNSDPNPSRNFSPREDLPSLKRRKSSDPDLDISSCRRPGPGNFAVFDKHGRSIHVNSQHHTPTFFGTEFSHVDIMYIPTDGKLVCRACHLESTKLRSDAAAQRSPFEPKSFPTTALWDELRDHCVKEHPAECEDVCRLHPAELFQLRKRLNLMS